MIRTRDPGWVLDVELDSVDALRFGALTASARVRRAREEVDAAAADLAAALGLWRGAALVDVVDASVLSAQATRLEEARLDAIEDLAAAELETWRAPEALARLEPHVEANRLRERGWGLLMVALYRLGRQAAALRAFQQVRAILGEELGLEPSPQLVEIERRILLHDPSLGAPRAPIPGHAALWTPPGQELRPRVPVRSRPSPPPQRIAASLPSSSGAFDGYLGPCPAPRRTVRCRRARGSPPRPPG